jgi:DNA-directed RNA polymerase subunit RPC12/RpoP
MKKSYSCVHCGRKIKAKPRHADCVISCPYCQDKLYFDGKEMHLISDQRSPEDEVNSLIEHDYGLEISLYVGSGLVALLAVGLFIGFLDHDLSWLLAWILPGICLVASMVFFIIAIFYSNSSVCPKCEGKLRFLPKFTIKNKLCNHCQSQITRNVLRMR